MKLTENTVSAISAVLLIATTCTVLLVGGTCTVLLVGGLNMSPVSANEHGRVDVTASTHD
jgi:hypothetical protein